MFLQLSIVMGRIYTAITLYNATSMPLTPEWMVSQVIPWSQGVMEEPNEYLLSELIGKYEATLKYVFQNHGLMEKTFNSIKGFPGRQVGWPVS